ncbi:methyltransferase domain-containing protein [uncultured Microscilla sp.]|uniref:methyltransferase domain-containing protein n=1 Tax=uncultured Microscilla sp. TaxID=432653 RepID=UPI002630AF03|nr:methyltransferase domain-containing protein [uncultured Microscilla sp.]
MNTTLDKDFWSNRYQAQDTGWDAGSITTPIKAYVDQLEDKHLKILVPGAGNSHEAEYLHQQGFTNVTVIDIVQAPLDNLKSRSPDFPEAHLLQGDFFELAGQYDLIIEQTFFCALNPSLRESYVQKVKSLLKPEGKLVGVLFCNVFLDRTEPPFGATEQQHQEYFLPHFTARHFALCYNSIAPRQDTEWFICLIND